VDFVLLLARAVAACWEMDLTMHVAGGALHARHWSWRADAV
jgi:hypothetical protein